MRASLSFLTSTSGIAPAVPTATGAYRLEMLGLHRAQRAVYFLEHLQGRAGAVPGARLLYVMHLSGEHAGRLATAVRWYQGLGDDDQAFQARLAALTGELVPLEAADPDDWALSTRVVQHRALRLPEGQPSIRKFALALQIDPIVEPPQPASESRLGTAAVTAYLRPRASLDAVWALPHEPLAIARVAFIGVPSDTGHDKHTAVLVRRPPR